MGEMPGAMWYVWLVVTVLYAGLLVNSFLSFRKQMKEIRAIHADAKRTLLSAKDAWKSVTADEQLFKEFILWKMTHGGFADEHVRVDH